MHAVVVRSTINDIEQARKILKEEGAPRISRASGFVAAQWVMLDESTGTSMLASWSLISASTGRSQTTRRRTIADINSSRSRNRSE